jgi:hypothetical protein
MYRIWGKAVYLYNKTKKAMKSTFENYNAIIKVNYDGMKGKKYPIHEIVSTRVTIKKENRLIDFNINEVEIKLTKEAQFMRELILNKIVKN